VKLKQHPISYNGGVVGRDEFAYRAPSTAPKPGFNPEGITAIVFWCPNGTKRLCDIPLTLGPPIEASADRRWHWDGNMEAPTITPSIGCENRCGWHGHITNGEATK